MRKFVRLLFLIGYGLFFCLAVYTPAAAQPFQMTSSTQFLWGDDDTGSGQAILAQYLRFSYNPEASKLSAAGYGRIYDAFSSGSIRDNGVNGRLYYLYLDIAPIENVDLRLGRQYVNFSSGSSLLDGGALNLHKLGPVGITVAGGRDIKFNLDSEQSRSGNYFMGIDVHLEGVKNTQLGVSYVRRSDDWSLAREEVGLNFRYIYKFLSPYTELRYDILSKVLEEGTIGIDLFPATNLAIKAEYYQSFPTFNSTDIYSVFAVDKYHEYLVRVDYSLDTVLPMTPFVSYARQTYEDDENANNFIIGTRFYPIKELTVNLSFDKRTGYGGKTWGFELTGDYRINNKFLISAGAQYDTYMRPDQDGNSYAQRYWLGGRWIINGNLSAVARIEEDINENFDHRLLGRVGLNWNL